MSTVREIKNEQLGERYYEYTHASGLKILICPKEGYSSTYAMFGTKYGSIDTDFRIRGEESFTSVPEGIAHFLEHKLFESEELDAFTRYAETGANANAFTSFDRTCYLFSCADNFKASLEILLDFVTHPYFTAETVEKEQGIIGQEIKMCNDEPSWKALFALLRAMYENHPVRIDIAGTVESIGEITAELLYKCYETFYNFNNMVLAVAGNVTPEAVSEVADRVLKKTEPIEIERRFHTEKKEVCERYREEYLPVASPIFALGFKENVQSPERSLKEVICSNILLQLIAGKTTALYETLLNEELINTSFDAELMEGYGYACLVFSGESRDPKRVQEAIITRIRELKQSGIDKADFERIRRKMYGGAVLGFNDIGTIANALVDAHFNGESLFAEMEVLEALTVQDIEERLRASVDTDCCSLAVVKDRK